MAGGAAEIIEKITGRKPDDAKLKRIHSVASALGVSDNDAFMALIIALDHYWGLYSYVPKKINEVIDNASKAAADAAKIDIEKLAADQKRLLADAVYKSSEAAAKAASTKTMLKWIAGAVVISSLAVCGLGFYAYKQGFKAGSDQGYVNARNEELILKQRDDFAKTKLYDLVLKYDQAGLLSGILNCSRKGWEKEKKDGKTACFPSNKAGWYMPQE